MKLLNSLKKQFEKIKVFILTNEPDAMERAETEFYRRLNDEQFMKNIERRSTNKSNEYIPPVSTF